MMPWELKPAPTNSPATSGVWPEAEVHVRSERLRCAQKALIRAGAQHGHRPLRRLADRPEVLPVRLELAEGEVVTDGLVARGLPCGSKAPTISAPGCV